MKKKKERQAKKLERQEEAEAGAGWTFCAPNAQTRKVSTKSIQPETIKEKCWESSAPVTKGSTGWRWGSVKSKGVRMRSGDGLGS